jgi:hypothetical protein
MSPGPLPPCPSSHIPSRLSPYPPPPPPRSLPPPPLGSRRKPPATRNPEPEPRRMTSHGVAWGRMGLAWGRMMGPHGVGMGLGATRFHYPYFRTGFWVRGGSRAFARISSRTLGRYVAVTNPAPPRCRSNGFQRISGALQTPDPPPKSRDSGTGHLGHQNAAPIPHSRHLTRPGSCAAETTALGPTGAHLGGLPGGGAPVAGAPSPVALFAAMPRAPRSGRPKTKRQCTP